MLAMARIKLNLPDNFNFNTELQVRITDINYGGHVGNDKILTLVHEARMLYLRSFGYTEMQFAGIGMIMSDVAIEFKNEMFFGDVLKVYVAATDFTKVSFDLYYKLVKVTTDKEIIVANAKTGMVCYDYDAKKVVAVPEEAIKKLSGNI